MREASIAAARAALFLSNGGMGTDPATFVALPRVNKVAFDSIHVGETRERGGGSTRSQNHCSATHAHDPPRRRVQEHIKEKHVYVFVRGRVCGLLLLLRLVLGLHFA